MVTVVGRILGPKRYSNPGILIPGTYKYATFHGKRDFANVRKLRILRRKDYLGSSGWGLNIITKLKEDI